MFAFNRTWLPFHSNRHYRRTSWDIDIISVHQLLTTRSRETLDIACILNFGFCLRPLRWFVVICRRHYHHLMHLKVAHKSIERGERVKNVCRNVPSMFVVALDCSFMHKIWIISLLSYPSRPHFIFTFNIRMFGRVLPLHISSSSSLVCGEITGHSRKGLDNRIMEKHSMLRKKTNFNAFLLFLNMKTENIWNSVSSLYRIYLFISMFRRWNFLFRERREEKRKKKIQNHPKKKVICSLFVAFISSRCTGQV